VIISIGYERNAHEIASPKFASAIKSLGIEAVVLWMSGTSINPCEGIWDFHSVNACWHAFNDVGLKVILTRLWAPAHSTTRGTRFQAARTSIPAGRV
jgi:multimeric flavodoxin WrbA